MGETTVSGASLRLVGLTACSASLPPAHPPPLSHRAAGATFMATPTRARTR